VGDNLKKNTKNTKNRTKPVKEKSVEPATIARTDSVRELKGLLRRKGQKAVSIEEMNAAIIRSALRGNT
jgi:hypothetical protein